jgi:hypothetical protein
MSDLTLTRTESDADAEWRAEGSGWLPGVGGVRDWGVGGVW